MFDAIKTDNFINGITIFLLILTAVFLFWRVIYYALGFFPYKKFKPAETKRKYAVLIPARDESRVIREVLISLKNQNYPADLIKTYVIINDENDATAQIAAGFANVEVLVAPDQKSKGDALDACIKSIKSDGEKFDGYFIFDADNVAAPDFIDKMNDAFDAGYEIIKGNQNCKNWNTNWVSACSALIFTIINKFQNKGRSFFNGNIVFSGSGILISSKILDGFDGWPFKTLTEDYEMTVWATAHGVKTTFVGAADYLDEAPTSYKVTEKQRIRWVKGFLQSRAKYGKELRKRLFARGVKNRWSVIESGLGVSGIITMAAAVIWYAASNLFVALLLCGWRLTPVYLLRAAWAFGAYYVFMLVYTLPMMICEQRRAKLPPPLFIQTLLAHPVFIGIYLKLYVQALLTKEIVWMPTPHSINVSLAEKTEDLDLLRVTGLEIEDYAADEYADGGESDSDVKHAHTL